MNLRLRAEYVVSFIFLLCVGLLAILNTIDPDAWIHLTYGRLIWSLKGFPVHEPYIPALAGEPFSYSSWLFGVLYYGAYLLFDTYGVILLKAGSVVLIFAILLKDSLAPYRNRLAALSILIVIAVCMRLRFVERPDTFLMIFLPFSIMALNSYLIDNNRHYLYALPFIHLLWANSHSSINLMFIPFLAVLVGGGIGTLLEGRRVKTGLTLSRSQARFITLILAASLVCALISPYGIKQFTFASQFLRLDVFKQEVSELLPTSWIAGCRWFYILTAFTVLSFIAAGRRLSLGDLLRIIPFIYLGLLSRRFIFIFAVVAAPILTRNISAALERVRRTTDETKRQVPWPVVVIVGCWVVGWAVVSLAQIGPFRDKSFVTGFGFNRIWQPEDALSYMDRFNINGRVFNSSMMWGQYIEWRDAPRRVPFIDGRGYLPPNQIEQYFSRLNWDELADKYDINVFLIGYPTNPALKLGITDRDIALDLPGWVLVYWDDVSLLYLKRGGKYDEIIRKDEYRVIKPANGLKGIEAVADDPVQGELLIRELQRNINDTGSSRAYLLLGKTYLRTGKYRQAIEMLMHVKGKYVNLSVVSADIGRCYEQLGDMSQAMQWYQTSLRQQENSEALFRSGALLLKSGDTSEAVKQLKKALQHNKELVSAYPLLVEAYRKLGREADAAKVIQESRNVMVSSKGEGFFNLGVKAYLSGSYVEAAAAFEQAIEANPSHALSYVNLGFALYDMGQIDKAFTAFQQALQLPPENALAHYGVAMIYKRRGDQLSANIHWKRYLVLEPSGYYARQVKQELERGDTN